MKTYGVIMAGGGGTRFWPLSRREVPKQLLNLSGKDLMVNETIDRFSGIIKKEDIFIVTNVSQARLMETATEGRIEKDHILAEPAARNTAACIGYAAMEIIRKYGDGVMCILPSDHYIKDLENYQKVLEVAVKTAKTTDNLVTIGIKPTFPSTGYGYIKFLNKDEALCYQVHEFVEKPDIETAKEYIKEGSYLWNSGMFVWKASLILEKFRQLLPDIFQCLEEIGQSMQTTTELDTIQRIYPNIPKISIDYGIMERAQNVVVIEGDFGWSDVGSWDALETIYEKDEHGNINYGDILHVESKNCIAYAQNKLVTTIGLENVIVVETDDAILVCHKDRAQDVRKVVEKLDVQGKTQYL